MCGIFGAVSENSLDETIDALKLLEYRGYDSAGVALKSVCGVEVIKVKGRIAALSAALSGHAPVASAIGHTRWATHGKVSKTNAHPFYSDDKNFAIVHNGIIENYAELKSFLSAHGYKFRSETDSETIAHMLEYEYKGDALSAVLKTAKHLRGAYAIAAMCSYDGNVYALKNKNPLVAALAGDKTYICSDVKTAGNFAEKVAVIPDRSAVVISRGQVKCYDYDGKQINLDYISVKKAEYAEKYEGDIMLKEIYEIPAKIKASAEGYISTGGIGIPKRTLNKLKRIYLLACGTAYNSGLSAAAVMRRFLDIDVIPVLASEFIYDRYPVDKYTLSLIITQSGETADTIRAAEKVKSLGGFTYAVTNVENSSVCFVADAVKLVNAGGEYAVASTKAYNCQLTVLILMALDIALAKNCISYAQKEKYTEALSKLPAAVEQILANAQSIQELAKELKNTSAIFYLGRKSDYPTAVEGSLKLKEISYIHSEAYAAGELKHGTLALVEKGVTVVALACDDDMLHKMNAAVSEVSSRGGEVIIVSPFGKEKVSAEAKYFIGLPIVNDLFYGIVSVVPLQLMAYYFAKELGRDVDKPRNLAKSVTVE